jgi:hypothetical protein
MCRKKGKVEDNQGWIEIGIKRERGSNHFSPLGGGNFVLGRA